MSHAHAEIQPWREQHDEYVRLTPEPFKLVVHVEHVGGALTHVRANMIEAGTPLVAGDLVTVTLLDRYTGELLQALGQDAARAFTYTDDAQMESWWLPADLPRETFDDLASWPGEQAFYGEGHHLRVEVNVTGWLEVDLDENREQRVTLHLNEPWENLTFPDNPTVLTPESEIDKTHPLGARAVWLAEGSQAGTIEYQP
jgi:hypothetical protein